MILRLNSQNPAASPGWRRGQRLPGSLGILHPGSLSAVWSWRTQERNSRRVPLSPGPVT